MVTYAEVHYRPWFVPSLIYMKQPEIVFDAPSRVETGNPIPVFVIIKDADRFPIQINAIVIHVISPMVDSKSIPKFGGIQ